jgi:hypothetical protein
MNAEALGIGRWSARLILAFLVVTCGCHQERHDRENSLQANIVTPKQLRDKFFGTYVTGSFVMAINILMYQGAEGGYQHFYQVVERPLSSSATFWKVNADAFTCPQSRPFDARRETWTEIADVDDFLGIPQCERTWFINGREISRTGAPASASATAADGVSATGPSVKP